MLHGPRPSQWKDTPLTGKFPDDDSGYRNVHLVDGNVSIAEVNDCIVREVYSGVDIQGNQDDSLSLPGGFHNGKVYGVDTVVEGISLANDILKAVSDGEFQLIVLEVLRTPARQRAGHRKTMFQMLEKAGISKPTPAQILMFGRDADEVFSYVAPLKDAAYETFFSKLLTDTRLVANLREGARIPKEKTINSVLEEYITILASAALLDAEGAGLTLPASHNVHGAGAFDCLVGDRKGRALSVTPYDYMKVPRILPFRYLEDDTNYDDLMNLTKDDEVLQDHFRKLGYQSPEQFTLSEWKYFQEANRMLFHCLMGMGATTYAPEHWHFEFGTQIWGLNAKDTIRDRYAAEFPFSGGPGYTAIRGGRYAVWHMASTMAACKEQRIEIAI